VKQRKFADVPMNDGSLAPSAMLHGDDERTVD
jgi:hypothetical protein